MENLIPESWIKLIPEPWMKVRMIFETPELWDKAKIIRNYLLSESDWVTLPDANPANKQAWLDYRQALRDIPQNFSEPKDIIWPTEP